MAFETYDRAIEQARTQHESVKAQAEGLVPEFKRVVTDYVIDFSNYLLDRAVRDKPEVVMEVLGVEKVSQLKEKFGEILKSVPDRTSGVLEKVMWAHRGDPPKELESNMMISYDLSKKTNESIVEAIRDLIGNVGALLIEYGLANVKEGGEWKQRAGTYPRYGYGFPEHAISHSAQLKEINTKYNALINNYVESARALMRAEKEKKIAQAKNLWDQA